MRPLCREEGSELYRIGNGTIPTLMNKTGDWRFSTPVRRETTSPCRAACPLHGNIAAWVAQVKNGDLAKAWEILSRSNPFPIITGTVCYHYCEDKCSRGEYDQSVAVGELERQIGLWRHQQFFSAAFPNLPIQELPVSIAVVGSGPAGLACAYYLRMLGVQVTVFEREAVPGGLLALGIPEYRLPRDVVIQEVAILETLGVVFRYGVELGRDVSLSTLERDFHAVFLATGASHEKLLSVDGENLPGVYGALHYLRAVHLGETVPESRSVVVIGGGNAAIDAACTARLRGADVVVVYRRSRDAMPAHPEEVRAAEEAGVQFLFQVAPEAVLGKKTVQQISLLQTDAVSRENPVRVIPHSSFLLDCDTVLVAVGQEPVTIFNEDQIACSNNSSTGRDGVFAGGDLATGPATVAAAIAAGREGARAIVEHLEIGSVSNREAVFAPALSPSAPMSELRPVNPILFPLQERMENLEGEAARCLSCGQCNGCGVCWLFCPDIAVVQNEVDCQVLLDYCKGCGICVRECPGGALEMEVGTGDNEDYHG